MRNCEDAYGFPPYSEIEGFLRCRDGSDLKEVERAIVAGALSGVPASLLRSETMDWCDRVPHVMSRWNAAGRRNGADPHAPRGNTGGIGAEGGALHA